MKIRLLRLLSIGLLISTAFTLLLSYASFATMPSSSWGLEIMVLGGRMGAPFTIYCNSHAHWSEGESSFDLTLPKEIRVLKGNPHVRSNNDSLHHGFSQEIVVQVDQPGIYDISAEYKVANVTRPELKGSMPMRYKGYLYVRSDTVALFYNRAELESKIRDSLICPSSEGAARLWRRDNAKWRAEHRDTIKTATGMKITANYFIDQIKPMGSKAYELMKNARGFMNSKFGKQYRSCSDIIENNQLYIMQPDSDRITQILLNDSCFNLSEFSINKKQELVRLSIQQLTELSNYDYLIITTDSLALQKSMLEKRREFIEQHKKELQIFLDKK